MKICLQRLWFQKKKAWLLMKNRPEHGWRGIQACGEVDARCWCRGKGSWGNLRKIGTWTLRILGYQPAGRHLESGYLNLFEVRVSCRRIGQRVWRATEADLKPLLLLLVPPASFSNQGATSRAPVSWSGARGSGVTGHPVHGAGRTGAVPPACQGLAKGMATGMGMQKLQWEVEGQKKGGDFNKRNQVFFLFLYISLFFFHIFALI